MTATQSLVVALKENDQDFEWYPSTREMVNQILKHIPEKASSILDIGAGDGRVLKWIGEKCEHAKLYGIEKSQILVQEQPADVIPVGTDIFEQQLASLQVDYIFCNPIYSQYEEWMTKIIDEGYAKKAWLIVPQRWKDNKAIADSLRRRGADARAIYHDDFLAGDRKARAVIDIVEISFPREKWGDKPTDPFDIWFDQNVGTFDKVEDFKEPETRDDLARKWKHANIDEMVAAYNEESGLLRENYQKIFTMDLMILQELGVNKDAVREGLKMKMAGLKVKYWKILFKRLDALTSRLTTASAKKLIEKLTSNTSVNFTVTNAYAVVIWAIKSANAYFDEQLTALFFELAEKDGVMNFKSNQKTWGDHDWRYRSTKYTHISEDYKPTHFQLDYRIITSQWHAIKDDSNSDYSSRYIGNLHENAHALCADIIAVFATLGFKTNDGNSESRDWERAVWENWMLVGGTEEEILFQLKAYLNGSVHIRFHQDAIKALNIRAACLLKWVRSEEEVVTEMGYSPKDARKWFKFNSHILPSSVALLGLPAPKEPEEEMTMDEELEELNMEELEEKYFGSAEQEKLF